MQSEMRHALPLTLRMCSSTHDFTSTLHYRQSALHHHEEKGHLVVDGDWGARVCTQHSVDGVYPLHIPCRKLGSPAGQDVDAVPHHKGPRQELRKLSTYNETVMTSHVLFSEAKSGEGDEWTSFPAVSRPS